MAQSKINHQITINFELIVSLSTDECEAYDLWSAKWTRVHTKRPKQSQDQKRFWDTATRNNDTKNVGKCNWIKKRRIIVWCCRNVPKNLNSVENGMSQRLSKIERAQVTSLNLIQCPKTKQPYHWCSNVLHKHFAAWYCIYSNELK